MALALGGGNNINTPGVDTILQILFNAGDWATLHCYSLLLLVWIEVLLKSRVSLWAVPSRQIARDWRRALLSISAAVQLAQAGLYSAALIAPQPAASQVLISIYVLIAAFNFALATLAIVGSAMAFFLYAGLPFRSQQGKAAFSRVVWLATGWTLGRIAWGVLALYSDNDTFTAAVASIGAWFFSVTAVAFFSLAELLPFLAVLGPESLAALGWEGGGVGGGGGGGLR